MKVEVGWMGSGAKSRWASRKTEERGLTHTAHHLYTMRKNLPRAHGQVCGRRSVLNDLLAAAMGELKHRGGVESTRRAIPDRRIFRFMGKEVVRIGSHDLNTSWIERWVLEDLGHFSLSGFIMRPLKITYCPHIASMGGVRL